MLVPIANDAVQVSSDAPVSADPYRNGIRFKADNSAVYVLTSAPSGKLQNGLPLSSIGQIYMADYSAGLPDPVFYLAGIPMDEDEAVCYSTNPATHWQNGLPFDDNGALVVEFV